MNTRLVLRLAGASRLVARRPTGREGGREGGMQSRLKKIGGRQELKKGVI
jgi:hypothetical protein